MNTKANEYYESVTEQMDTDGDGEQLSAEQIEDLVLQAMDEAVEMRELDRLHRIGMQSCEFEKVSSLYSKNEPY